MYSSLTNKYMNFTKIYTGIIMAMYRFTMLWLPGWIFFFFLLGKTASFAVSMVIWQKGQWTTVKCIITRLTKIFLCPSSISFGWSWCLLGQEAGTSTSPLGEEPLPIRNLNFSSYINKKILLLCLSNYALGGLLIIVASVTLTNTSQASTLTMWTLLVT